MPYGYGSANQSGTSSSRDTGSNYGQFDRAVSRAANNPPASTPSGNGNNKEKATIEAILKAVTTAKAPPSILNPYVPPVTTGEGMIPGPIKGIIDRPESTMDEWMRNDINLRRRDTPPVGSTMDEWMRNDINLRRRDTPPSKDVTKIQDEYKQSLVDTTNYKDKIGRGLFSFGLSKNPLLKNINPLVGGFNLLSNIFGWGKKVDPYSTLKSTLSKRKTTPKTGIETIELGDGKTGIETIARGDSRQIEKPTVQEAISKGEGLESGKKLLGLSDEETNYIKKLFASRDRKFLQSIFDKGTTRIQSGKATQKEQDVYTLLQQYLVDPKEGIMGVA